MSATICSKSRARSARVSWVPSVSSAESKSIWIRLRISPAWEKSAFGPISWISFCCTRERSSAKLSCAPSCGRRSAAMLSRFCRGGAAGVGMRPAIPPDGGEAGAAGACAPPAWAIALPSPPVAGRWPCALPGFTGTTAPPGGAVPAPSIRFKSDTGHLLACYDATNVLGFGEKAEATRLLLLRRGLDHRCERAGCEVAGELAQVQRDECAGWPITTGSPSLIHLAVKSGALLICAPTWRPRRALHISDVDPFGARGLDQHRDDLLRRKPEQLAHLQEHSWCS